MEEILIDEETGESIFGTSKIANDPPLDNDAETGEPEIDVNSTAKRRRVPFQIPRDVKNKISSMNKKKEEQYQQGFIDVEPVTGSSFAQTNPICLFLLAIVYFRWVLALLTILEVAFHMWAHRKNKRLKDTNVFFRSPFHGVTSEFCALCQNENCMDRVGKMQERRMHKFLRQCNYMKRAVT